MSTSNNKNQISKRQIEDQNGYRRRRFRTFDLCTLILDVRMIILISAVCCLTFVGCGPQRGSPLDASVASLTWPEPPEPARIAYLGAVSTAADMDKRGSVFEGLGELLFGKKPVGVLVSPYAVAVDPTGIMYVADSGGAAVHAFDLRAHDYHQFSALDQAAKLQKPIGLALLGDRIYVADSGLREVCVFRKTGSFLFAFGRDRLARPAGIACRFPQGTIYVADAGNHTVEVFDRGGRFLRRIGSRGTGAGQFNFPTQLCLDRTGKLYVSDTLNYRIQVFGPDERFLRMFGRQGDRPGNFAHPSGVACDSLGNIYVTDRQFENVQIFDAQGQILMALGQEGTAPGEFWLPAGICTDLHNRIYVADSFNKRVQIFALLEEKE
jgi:DNA-binding beta-propeller fold protein YncE